MTFKPLFPVVNITIFDSFFRVTIGATGHWQVFLNLKDYFISLLLQDYPTINLKDAIFKGADLKRVQALATNFEGATLTSACIEDWNINSQTNLQNVKCDYIYFKEIYSEEEGKLIFTDTV